jgi:hypothetical protein
MDRNGLVKYKQMSIEFSKALNHPIDVYYEQENDYYICYDAKNGDHIIEFETGHIPQVSEVEIHFQKLGRRHYHENVAAFKKRTRDFANSGGGLRDFRERTNQFRKDGHRGAAHSIIVPTTFDAREKK